MSGYTRADYERDLAWADWQDAELARALVAGAGPLEVWQAGQEVEEFRRRCKGKLAGVRLAIEDRERTERTGKLVYWRRRWNRVQKRVPPGGWVPTTEHELEALRRAGWFVVEHRGFAGERKPKDAAPGPPLPVKRVRLVTVEVARELAREPGVMLKWAPDGREDVVEVVEYC